MMCSRPARDAPTSTAWPATCIRVRPPPPRGPSRAPSKRQHARSAHMLQRKGSGSGSGGGALAAACLLLPGRLGSYSPMSRARRVMLWGGRARSVTCMAGGRLSAAQQAKKEEQPLRARVALFPPAETDCRVAIIPGKRSAGAGRQVRRADCGS